MRPQRLGVHRAELRRDLLPPTERLLDGRRDVGDRVRDRNDGIFVDLERISASEYALKDPVYTCVFDGVRNLTHWLISTQVYARRRRNKHVTELIRLQPRAEGSGERERDREVLVDLAHGQNAISRVVLACVEIKQ